MITCSKCQEEKDNTNYYKHSRICKDCRKEYQKLKRSIIDNLYTKRYEKTKKGFLVRMYRNMTSRINGIQTKNYHLYQNKEILGKEEFYNWALNNNKFHELFNQWEANYYSRKITPSIDRIDANFGYIIGNIQFLTLSENCSKTSRKKQP